LCFINCFLLIGYFNRHAADDLEMINYTRDLGVLKATLRFYKEWEGAFTPFFFENVIIGKIFYNDGTLIGYAIMSMLLFIYSFCILTKELLKKAFNNVKVHWYYIFVTAMLYMGAAYFITPDIGMIWHWMVGSIAYLYTISILFICIAFILRMYRTGKKRDLIIATIFAFLLGATRFNIDATVFGFGIIFLILTYYYKKTLDRRYYVILGAFIVSFIIYLLAPGNYVRQNKELLKSNQEYTYLSELINVTARVSKSLFIKKMPYLIILLSPLLIIGHNLRTSIKEKWSNYKTITMFIIITIFVLYIAVIANITILYISIGKGDQAAKVWTLIIFIYVAAVSSWFIVTGYLISKKNLIPIYIVAFTGIILSSYLFVKTMIIQYPIIKEYAKAYDARVTYLNKAKIEKLVMPGDTLFLEPLPPSGLLKSAEIMDYTNNYINRSTKQRYNLPFEILPKK
ncbi:MAG TPA: DUF6056 family protein, partial [Bacteroidales bacterium]|nr:DUF6056 family protein [Bacteroidales bacterium]